MGGQHMCMKVGSGWAGHGRVKAYLFLKQEGRLYWGRNLGIWSVFHMGVNL